MNVLISIGLCYGGTQRNRMGRSRGRNRYVRVLVGELGVMYDQQ